MTTIHQLLLVSEHLAVILPSFESGSGRGIKEILQLFQLTRQLRIKHGAYMGIISFNFLAESNFFVKASERRQQKRQQKELVLIDSPEENGEICSPPSSVANGRSTPGKLKRQDSSTPRKEKRNSTPSKKMKSGKRESCCGQIPFDLAVDEQQLRTIPDLRLEAKLSSEENSRIFAGRQIHPFFTSWKGVKSSQDLTDSESKWSSFERKEKGIAFNNIHVFEDVEDDHMTLSWGHWIFSERSAIADLDCGCSPVYEGSIDSLNFDNFRNISHFTRTSLYQNSHPCSVQPKEVPGLPDKPECSYSLSPLLIADKREICSEQQKDSDMLPKDAEAILATSVESMQEHKLEENDLCDAIPCVGSLESELQHRLLEERIMSHYHTCQNQPENCLWTDKYQPQNAKQICGNGESVEFLSEWLHLWHKRGSLTSRGCIDEDYSIVQDIDHDYQQSDSDTNSSEESLKNVLLVTGPVGSGKSAAIYACARDQGFQIIEINASDWRNGALVKQKFGEAVESHWLQRTVENATKSDNKSLSKFFNAVNTETHCSDDEVIELTHLSDKEDSQDAGSWPKMSACGYNRTAKSQSEIKTLILFEDVDATVHEDQGFITTIQQLAVTAKRPMILTSNSDNPVLPKNLDRLDVSFSVPSVKELLRLVSMICAAEKANIHPCLIERFVNYCQGDVRKTIMLLQFWCQGRTPGRGNELHATYQPLLFDLDAGHHILPRVIPWGYPSQLSELVADEIAKSLTLMEETHGLMDTNIVEDLNGYTTENIHVQVVELDPVEVKKEAMLSFQCSLLDEFECAQFEAKCELSDFSSSPIAFARQNSRRKVNTVLSSDSEDELSCGSIPLVSAGVDIDAEILDVKNTPETCHLAPAPIFHSEVDNSEDNRQLLERVDCSHIEDTCISHDMSFVPESTFVPETEILHETELYSTTVSYGHFNAVGDICIFQDQDSITIEPAIGSQSTNSLHIMCNDQDMLGNNFDFSTCVDQEEVGDSLSKSEAGVPGGYQPLDECSRMVFMKRLQPLDNPETDQVIDFVKETWKKLHVQCKDLRKHATAEERTARQVLILAHGMSNLISEADLLLKDCQTLVFDSLESSLVPSEKTHSYTYSDTQLEMSSILAQHGMCCYAKEIASLGSVMGPTNTVDLASEMLSSSASSVALGKLASQDQRKVDRSDDMKTTKHADLSVSKSDSSLCNIVQTIVPSRSYLAAKGAAFHEYISTLSQISRYESSRLSECIDSRRKQRRARIPRHYLSSGSLAMSPEEISLLGQYNSFQNIPFS
ncbi:hypothetical protein DH2020_034232 [Rehmannia glutinosa]|uniref:AAA+ ATPase domain-containing protein n=1 Tax=Rehmannia glutinosa TaxID=99300 RepID=A0ABR0VAD5_REHGL